MSSSAMLTNISEDSTLEEGAKNNGPEMPLRSRPSVTKELSSRSKMYDVDGDGVLDDTEKAMRAMDDGTGHISNKQVYQMMMNQFDLQKQMFNMKRIVVVLSALVLILALSNLGTAWAAASLVKDTSTSDGALISKNNRQVLATNDNAKEFVAATDTGTGVISGRRTQETSVSAGSRTIPKGTAAAVFNHCPQPAIINRNFPNGGLHQIQVCPVLNYFMSGSGTDTPTYTYAWESGMTLTISCPAGGDEVSCDMTGDALLLPAGSTCVASNDCQSNSCVQSVCQASTGTSYYVKQDAPAGGTGTESSPFNSMRRATRALNPGDTLYFMGTFTNPSYIDGYTFSDDITDPHLWNQENTIYVRNINGLPGQHITFRPYNGDTVFKGDGANILRILNSSYLRFIGFEIQGEVDNIPLSTAHALQFVYKDPDTNQVVYRVNPPDLPKEEIAKLTLPLIGAVERPSYIDTRGIYAQNCHHLVFEENHVHHVPGNGVRFAFSEYIDFFRNEVHDTSRKSYSGTHGVVATQTKDEIMDDPSGSAYRVRIVGNKVHHNYNEMYSWVGTKTFIHVKIDEGKGISLERNQAFNNGGRILLANNIAYWNGFSGVNNHDGDNVDLIGNTAYMNSYTNTITFNGLSDGKNVGVSMNGGDNCVFANNIAYVDTDVEGFPVSLLKYTNVEIGTNLVYGSSYKNLGTELKLDADIAKEGGTTIVADPLFVDATNADFNLQAGSPAIGAASPSYAELADNKDIFGNVRSLTSPTMGAIEYLE